MERAEHIQKILVSRDRLAIDLQTMIFYWMDQAFTLFFSEYRAAKPEKREAVATLLGTFRPEFLQNIYYEKTLKSLQEYANPVRRVEDVPL